MIGLLGLLAVTACGPGEPEIAIGVQMSPAIPAGATRAVVGLFPAAPPVPCEVIRLSEQDEQMPTRATYRSTVSLTGAPPHSTEFFDLVPGDYQVAVFVYDAASDLIGFGCLSMPVTIAHGERTEAPLIQVRPI